MTTSFRPGTMKRFPGKNSVRFLFKNFYSNIMKKNKMEVTNEKNKIF